MNLNNVIMIEEEYKSITTLTQCGIWWYMVFWLLVDPTLNTCPKGHLPKLLPHRHPCHTWDLEFGIPNEVVSPNFHALNG